MRKIKKFAITAVAGALTAGLAHAGTVNVDRSFAGADNIVSGNNLGGLNVGNAVLSDSDARGRLQVTIDDSAGSGATFTAVIHITGKYTASEVEGYRTSTGDDGRIFFRDNSLTREITLNVVDITETTSTGSSLSFDGFTKLDLGTSWTVATDQLNIDGTDYDGSSDPAAAGVLTLDALAPSGTVVDHTGTDVILKGLGTQWTVGAAVPSNTPPSFTSSPVTKPTAMIDVVYAGSLENNVFEVDGDAITYTKLDGPAWLNIATGTGALSGTPTIADSGPISSNNIFTVELSDVDGATTGEVHIVVSTGIGTIPTFTADPTVKQSATADVAYSESLVANISEPDGDTVTFTKITGADWLDVADGGSLTGTPGASDVGLNIFTVEVFDVDGASTGTVHITVNAAPLPDPGDAVNVDVNWNIEHSVGGVSDFNRARHITVHASLVETDWDGEEAKMDYMMNDLDVYFGRDNGSAGWKFKATTEDPARPNMANLSFMTNYGTYLREQYELDMDRLTYEGRQNEMIMGTTPHPSYPTLSWNDNGKTWNDWQSMSIETTTEWVVEYLDQYFRHAPNEIGEKLPMYWEVINEPDMELMTGQFMVSNWESIWEYHNLVANGVRARMGDKAPLIGGMTWGLHDLHLSDYTGRYTSNYYYDMLVADYPESAAFYQAASYTAYPQTGAAWEQWDTIWKGFIDHAGSNMDFYSIHIYDWAQWPNDSGGALRSGGHVEAMLDMIEWYDVHKFGVENRKPLVVSEYGALAGTDPTSPQSRKDWESLKAFSSMMLQFMERPDYIVKSMPFGPIKATWGDYWVGDTFYRYGYKMMDETSYGSGVWEWTQFIKFYELWSDVKGTRVDTMAADLDIQVDAYVDGNAGYLILNNLEQNEVTLKLNSFGASANSISSVQVKHLYLDESLGQDGEPVLFEEMLLTAPGSVTLAADATMILKYTFASPVTINEIASETKYYGDSLSGTTPFRLAKSNGALATTQINGVAVPAGAGEATLRIAGSFRWDAVTRDDPDNQVIINGHNLTYIADWRGEQGGRAEWFGVLEVPVPVEYLQVNNTVSCGVENQSMFTTMSMEVTDFSQAPGRAGTTASVPVTGMSIVSGTLSLAEQRVEPIQATVTPSDSSDKRITWSSSNPSAATVDELGLITAVTAGSATITGTTIDGGFSDAVNVTVTAFVPFEVESVRVNPANVIITLGGDTVTSEATVLPGNAANQAVTWSSSDSSVATVDASGVITAAGEGTATITATTTDGGFTDATVVTVPAPIAVTGVSLPASSMIVSGSTLQLSATVSPSDAYDKAVTWLSLSPAVATVDANGLVTAVGEGVAQIQVTTVEGGFTATTEVTVFEIGPDGASITLEAEDADVLSGVEIYDLPAGGQGINYVEASDYIEFTNVVFAESGVYKIEYKLGTNQDEAGISLLLDGVTVASDAVPNTGDWDTMITLQSGSYFATEAGSHTIRVQAGTAEWQWNMDNFTVTKVAEIGDPVPVDGVSVSPTSSSISAGTTVQLAATISPTDASNKSVTWISLNPSVATVDGNGLATGVAEGSAGIVVTTADGGFAATNQLTVTAGLSVTGVAVVPATTQVTEGSSVQLSADVSPVDAQDKSVTWESLNTSVATVDSNGLVSGIAEGTASIVVTTVDGGFKATNVTTVVPMPIGPVLDLSIVDGQVVINTTNGTADAYFNVLANTNLVEGAGWQVVASNLTFDVAGEAVISNSVDGADQIFYKIEDSGEVPPPPTEITATFTWSGYTGDWWDDAAYAFTETQNDLTMVHGGRTTVNSSGKAFKATYSQDAADGTIDVQYGGVSVNFTVTSIQVSGQSNGGEITPSVAGYLDGVQQWIILPPDDATLATYTASTTTGMDSAIDQIVWVTGETTAPGSIFGNNIDNLSVTATP